MSKLLESFQFGDLKLKNRVVMPPMTRSRAVQPGDIPAEMMVKYYSDRANAGLIISEGTQISPIGKGYAFTPGIYSKEQIEGWKKITDAVHKKGGLMFAQLWHVGRISHPDNNGGLQPVSSSAIQAEGVKTFIPPADLIQTPVPRALSIEEIKSTVADFKQAGANALEAGFDGVEVHAANGYLINQFIDSGANSRTDEYGGSLENRLRFLKEVVVALKESVPAKKIGIRLAPLTTLNGCEDANPEETYLAAARLLNDLGLGYIHIAEADWDDAPLMPIEFKKKLRDAFSGVIIYAGKYDQKRAEEAIESGFVDLIAFGRPFVANPDLNREDKK